MSKTVIDTYNFASKSNPDNSYATLVYADGSMSCNCPGWTRRTIGANNLRECKHTQLVENLLANKHHVQTPASRSASAKPVARKVRAFEL